MTDLGLVQTGRIYLEEKEYGSYYDEEKKQYYYEYEGEVLEISDEDYKELCQMLLGR